MRKIACFILVSLTLLLVADRLGGMAMRVAASRSNDVLSPKLRYIADSVHEDVVLLGASRCHHHYVPSVMAKVLGLSVYNAGVGGSDNIFSHYIVLRHILQRHTPRLVVLEVMTTDYSQQADPFATVSYFAPLFGRCAAADSVYHLCGSHWKYALSHLYRYNAKAPATLWGLVLNRQRDHDHGYMPLATPACPPTEEPAADAPRQVDSLKLSYLRRFIALCRERGAEVVLTVSPRLTRVKPSHYDVLRSLARHCGVGFLDYHTPGLYLDRPDLFRDASHLCDNGARRFSTLVAGDLKAFVQK